MHILHALFSSRIAGSERYCADLANRQAAAGHDVSVAGSPGSPLRELLSRRVRYHPLGWCLRGPRLRRLVRTLRPDISHGHLSAACKALAALPPGFHTVATLHVGYKRHQHGRLGGVICVNHAQSGRLAGYEGVVRVIPNWLPAPTPAGAGPGLRASLGIDPGTFLVGAVGRLHPSKGMDVLIAAFQECAPTDAALVILGEGPDRPRLEKLSAGDERIHLPGFRPDVQACLPDLDLFVCPSREESFGLAILEAMHARLPVIATATDGPAEFLRDHPVVLVPPGSTRALGPALTSAHDRFRQGGRGRQDYELGAFDAAARVESILAFYHQVAAAQRRRPVDLVREVPAST
ncbi:MAG TPA: glycosyltransferase family 4 protein [Lacunisphaera sp.]|nr:glycosyltransferase family 4 protein [Lacunisphaera sp.]